MASIIPPRRPKKPGMPKLTIPPRPDSSASTSTLPSQQPVDEPAAAGQRPQPPYTAIPQAGTSIPPRPRPTIITNNSARSLPEGRATGAPQLYIAPAAPPPSAYSYANQQEDDFAYEGHLPYQSTASSIYPDTVPAGPLTDHQAWTNDLKRAIGSGSGAGGRRTSSGDIGITRRYGDANGGGGGGGGNSTDRRRPPSLSNSADGDRGISSSSSTDQISRPSVSRSRSQGTVDEETTEDARSGDAVNDVIAQQRTAVGGDGQVEEEEEEEDWVLKGNLETLARLGEGASGEVRKARHKPTNLVMAVKTIPTSPNPSVHRQILREVSFNRTCYSPHIVKYYGAFLSSDSQSIEICMEYCEAGSLDAIYKTVKSRNGRTGEKILGRVAESVLKGLHYLHDRHIIHRDIKPSNIVVSREGQIKLCDFGVSGELINSLAGTFTGTSYYMAPERIKGLPYTITSDVWSLGLTILEVASHRFPFPPEGEPPLGPVDLLSYIVSMPTPELQDDPAAGIKWSRGLRDFIERCLDKNGETRLGPKKMLTHPFIRKSETRLPPADVGRFVADVYGWPTTTSSSLAREGADNVDSRGLTATNSPSVGGIGGGASASHHQHSVPTPSAEEVLRLSRIPSVRKAPLNPLAAMSLATTPSSSTSDESRTIFSSSDPFSSTRNQQQQQQPTSLPTPTAPGMPPMERVDLQGSSTSERLAAKMRERDAGICGSPLDTEMTSK